MIKLEITIHSDVINAPAMEEIRYRIQRDFLNFVYKHVDGVAEDQGYRFSRRDVTWRGDIKIIDEASDTQRARQELARGLVNTFVSLEMSPEKVRERIDQAGFIIGGERL